MEDTQLTIAMCVFKKRMRPAENAAEANELLSTREILEIFTELLGEEVIDQEVMYDLLTTHGFIYDYCTDGFKWLIKTS